MFVDVDGVQFTSESACDGVGVIRSHQLAGGMQQKPACWPHYGGKGLSRNKRACADTEDRPMQCEEASHRMQTPFGGPRNEERHHEGDSAAHTSADHGTFLSDTQ